MKPCPRCRRHVRTSETDCPFCDAALHDTLAPSPMTRALGLVLLTAACVPADPPLPADDTGPSANSSGAVDPTTTADTSESPASTSTSTCDSACSDASEAGSFLYATVDVPYTYECDPFEQDCPEGQKCSAYADDGGSHWNNLKCVPVPENARLPGEPCTAMTSGTSGLDDCVLGAMCWHVDKDTHMGTCVALCTGTADAPVCDDLETVCWISNANVLNLCLPICNPLAQDCSVDEVCIANNSSEDFVCVLDGSGDGGQQHDPCMFINACDPGLLCNDPTSANECDPDVIGCCEPFCDLNDPDADAQCGGVGQVCNPWFEEGYAPPDLANVGYCSIPM